MTSAREQFVSFATELSRMKSVVFDALSVEELLHIRSALSVIRRDLDVLDHKIVAVSTRKDAHRSAGATSMASLISAASGVTRRQATQTIKLAQRIDESPVLATQMDKPGMSPVKAHMITDALDTLPADIAADHKQQIEKELAESAPQMSVEQFRRRCRRALEITDRKRADRIEDDELVTNETAALRAASFWMSRPDSAGMVKGGFDIDALTADMLRSILESKTAPRQLAIQQRNGQSTQNCEQGTVEPPNAVAAGQAGSTDTSQQAGSQLVSSTNPNPPANYRETQGQAFIEILRHIPREAYGNHGGVAATLMVTVSEESLRERAHAAGITEHGTPVSAGQLRHLACTAGILPAVLDSQSQILDLGREQRLHSPAQRKALAHRDGGCAFPNCDRPPGWCETHHITPWSNNGQTTIDNGVLLCGYHHRHIHQSNWRIELNPHDKQPNFYPPGSTKPQRNYRYRPSAA